MPLLISSTSLYCLELTSYPLEEKGIKGSHEVALTIKSSNRIDLSLRRESRDVTSAEREKEVVKEEERRGGKKREREREQDPKESWVRDERPLAGLADIYMPKDLRKESSPMEFVTSLHVDSATRSPVLHDSTIRLVSCLGPRMLLASQQ